MRISPAIALLGIIAALAAPAAGQVAPTQTGAALDANPMVGSGGYNPSVRGRGGVDSQLYITGQVTGLAGFRGGVPYRAPNELSLDLPGNAISQFQAESVGVQDVVRAQPYVTSSYLDPLSAVSGTTSGRAATGVLQALPAIRTAVASPLGQQLFDEAMSGYVIPPVPAGTRPVINVPSLVLDPSLAAAPQRGEGMDTLFGVVSPQDRAVLARQLQDVARLRDAAEEIAPPSQVDSRITGAFEPAPAGEARIPPRLGEPQIAAPGINGQRVPQADLQTRGGPALPSEGADAYVDLLATLAGARRTQQRVEPERAESLRERLQPYGGRPSPLVEQRETWVILHGLAGTSGDLFNRYMSRAEQLLQSGQHYEAVQQFELAMTVDPQNPLARLGLALAYIGAGEPLSAATQWKRALDIFPPLIETRVDVAAMMNQGIFVETLKDVQERVAPAAAAVEPSLTFLSMMMSASLGEDEVARNSAARLLEQAPQDKTFSMAARFILTGNRPADDVTSEAR